MNRNPVVPSVYAISTSAVRVTRCFLMVITRRGHTALTGPTPEACVAALLLIAGPEKIAR